MPAVRTGVLGADEHLVAITEMEDWAQLAFDGYKCAPPACSPKPFLLFRKLARAVVDLVGLSLNGGKVL